MAIGIANGFRRGLWLSLARYLGLVVGVVAAATAAPGINSALHVNNAVLRPVVAVAILLVAGVAGSSIGYAIGHGLRRRVSGRPQPGGLDSAAGGVFSGLAVLAVAWFLGLSFDRGPSPQLAQLIQSSGVLRRLDVAAPRPPAFLSGVEGVLAGVPFPQTFAGLEPSLPGRVSLEPGTASTPGVLAAAGVTAKIEGRGCGGVVSGSGFPIGRNLILTNAHVVSGTGGTTVQMPNQQARGGRVVLFDPARDVAVILVPGLSVDPLQSNDSAGRGTGGAVIGYPGGGPETAVPAVLDGAVNARGRDIYNENLVNREIWVIEADVQPGNSGGPLVDTEGRVIGMVFAASSTHQMQAYALTNGEVASDVSQAARRTGAVDTRQYPCAL